MKSGLLKSLSAKELADGIKKMSPEAAAAVFADPEKLPAEAIAAMTPGQIAKMPPSAIGKLNREQLASFTPAQVKKMSLKQIRSFNDEFCDSTRFNQGKPARCYGNDVRDYWRTRCGSLCSLAFTTAVRCWGRWRKRGH